MCVVMCVVLIHETATRTSMKFPILQQPVCHLFPFRIHLVGKHLIRFLPQPVQSPNRLFPSSLAVMNRVHCAWVAGGGGSWLDQGSNRVCDAFVYVCSCMQVYRQWLCAYDVRTMNIMRYKVMCRLFPLEPRCRPGTGCTSIPMTSFPPPRHRPSDGYAGGGHLAGPGRKRTRQGQF